jgi:hypothetical protein
VLRFPAVCLLCNGAAWQLLLVASHLNSFLILGIAAGLVRLPALPFIYCCAGLFSSLMLSCSG